MDDLNKISTELTEDYLSKQLSKWFQKDVVYSKHEYVGGTGKGDSYLSDLYRIIFYGKLVSPQEGDVPEVSIKVILKCFPQNIVIRKTFRSHTFFKNEILFYEKVLPAMLKFQSRKKLENPFTNYPQVFAAVTNGKDDFLALEDLGIHGFGCAVRQEGIDYPHCQIILKTFAKFHALSFAFKDQNPDDFAKAASVLEENYYHPKHWDWYKGLWKLLCACSIDAVEKEYPGSIYEEKIKDFATPKTFTRMIEAARSDTKSAVFGHGDSWTPNFLFKYKEGTIFPTDTMMIDFQLARCASPILDIVFFIYACSSEELRERHYHDMLKYYYDVLSRQIKAMGSDPDKLYSWDDYMGEVKKYSYFGVAFSMESTPFIILDPEDAFEMDSMEGTEAVRVEDVWTVKPIKTKAGRLRMAGIIKHAVDNGYL